MPKIFQLVEKEKKKSSFRDLRESIEDSLKIAEDNIGVTLDALKGTISGHEWNSIDQDSREKMFLSFSTRFKTEESKQ